MKKYSASKIIGLLMVLFWVNTAVSNAASVDLYNPGSLGNGSSDGKFQGPLSNSGWSAHYSPFAALSQATQWSGGFVQGAVALLTHAGSANSGNPYRTNPVLLWTTNFTTTANIQSLNEVRFTQENNDAVNIVPRLALRVDNIWYISEKTFEFQGRKVTTVTDFNRMRWTPLSFDPGTVLKLEGNAAKPFADLTGTINGVGFFYEKITERARLREIRVRAESN